jgi:hypothetical protein
LGGGEEWVELKIIRRPERKQDIPNSLFKHCVG